MFHRFFYHCFPRRPGADPIERGLAILASIMDRGLLLSPEMFEITEIRDNGQMSQPTRIFQKRICFTELAPNELSNHSIQFGPFAIEWDISTLRRLGAVPVFYLPTSGEGDGMGAALVARLAEIQEILLRLEKMARTVRSAQSSSEIVNVTRDDTADGFADSLPEVQFLRDIIL